ncbi:LacI family transcriptional regulator [Subtercola boreus]|uniref:LacI family transcriptional regulator n=1 Tax=Subtercola boreus TaxID=120213 RepID=A0A3E0W214_9MICO|nr:LacI family DNA-binding transcriptional regulator [Subtercola boreus]RFA15543.1 LacI family transcriptional regulator [Subtercola boreus]
MKPNVGIREVAEHAGVSVGTVSNVLNHPKNVTPANLAKVQQSMIELGFVRNDLARQLRMGAGSTIGLVVLNISNPFFADLAHALEAEAEVNGHTVILGSSDQDAEREDRYIDLFEEQRVRGMLIAPLHGVTPRLSRLRSRGTPVILFDSSADPEHFCSVTLDGTAGGYMATNHLIDTGRRKILFAGGPFSQVGERLTGASKAAREHDGVTLSLMETNDLTVAEGREVGNKILAMPTTSRPDAIFAANDLLAVGILQSLILASDLSVPDDIALIGYDDIDFAASTMVPLSTIRQPRELIAREALRLLHEESDAGSGHVHGRHLFTPELVVRESTRPAERADA